MCPLMLILTLESALIRSLETGAAGMDLCARGTHPMPVALTNGNHADTAAMFGVV